MGKTKVSIQGEAFYINGKLVYEEIAGSRPEAHGLLMNARFIQGVFDDKGDVSRYQRFGGTFDPDSNTDDLIQALPQWYAYGLRAFTVGFQGGGPCFTIPNETIHNNPFGDSGDQLDPDYAARMDRLIRAADELGMVVIVSYMYPGQTHRLADGKAVLNAVRAASRFLKLGAYTNVLIEVCNEHDLSRHPLIQQPEGMVALMEIAREESGGMLVGCSGSGGIMKEEVCKESDVIFIHGNGQSRQQYCNMIAQARKWSPGKPVVCNEDSQAVGQLGVAFDTRTSWGYYNNLTKQEPPVKWGVTPGEDLFFAQRMAEGIGIPVPPIPEEKRYMLQGLAADESYEGKRWIRLAALYPEGIDRVEFYVKQSLVYTCYVEPFTVNFRSNWLQGPWTGDEPAEDWLAVVYLKNGEQLEVRA
ncbi:glycoside hydrolase family 5 protein [Paenibacillus soyae]|uniref:Glycoside hydrolase family 5 protein n=1 Tax=Paenibacillus soyae TaxID=2969249 RepID=A0A9X2MRB0_9BACL|nr:glycoside hydrolase family 5 protein [Paenibacillus soyae]MCR2804749.1 glycoside hydrolase family 5 protein [Paenibacillus soyae]